MANTLSIFLFSFFLICLIAKEVTSCRQEDYWKMKLPNVPIPRPISSNLFHSTSDDKVKANLNQPYTVFSWKYKDNKEKHVVNQPNLEHNEDEARIDQPHTVFSWKYKENDKEKANVPFTVIGWNYNENNKENMIVAQPKEKNGNDKANVPFTVIGWNYNENNKENVIVAQPKEKNGNDKANVAQPYTVFSWKYKEDSSKKEAVAQPNEGNQNEKPTVAQPRTMYSLNNKENDVKDKKLNNHQSHSHFMHHLNDGEDKDMVAGSVFFIEENLKLGKKFRHDFQKNPKANFLPRDIASSIPFTVDKYAEILDRLSIDPNSAEATSIKETLSLCLERPHVKKENRTCVQSMEELVDFVIEELGTNNVKVATMNTSEDKVPTGMQDYWIAKLNKLDIPNKDGVACHKMVYPYAVYWCHHQQDIGQYAVTLVNKDGVTIDTTAVCHYDTYAWEPEVPALRYLGIRPGDANVCHFAAINDMFWSLNGKITDGGVSQ